MRAMLCFTLVELLVVVAIVSILMSLLLPALSKVREIGNSAKCAGNLKNIGVAVSCYVSDNSDWLPVSNFAWGDATSVGKLWDDQLSDYLGWSYSKPSPPIFHCPSARKSDNASGDWQSRGYFINYYIYYDRVKEAAIRYPSKASEFCELWDATAPEKELFCYFGTVNISMFAEAANSVSYFGWRHNRRMNVLFVDGHTEPKACVSGYPGPGIEIYPTKR